MRVVGSTVGVDNVWLDITPCGPNVLANYIASMVLTCLIPPVARSVVKNSDTIVKIAMLLWLVSMAPATMEICVAVPCVSWWAEASERLFPQR